MSAGTIIGLVIALGTLITTLYLGLQRIKHERVTADKADARAVLAEGALVLGRTKGALRDGMTAFKRPMETGKDWPADTGDEIRALGVAAEELESALAAVRIRFPQNSTIVLHLDKAHSLARMVGIRYVLAHSRDSTLKNRKDPEEDFSLLWEDTQAFDDARDRFLDAAQEAAGVDLVS